MKTGMHVQIFIMTLLYLAIYCKSRPCHLEPHVNRSTQHDQGEKGTAGSRCITSSAIPQLLRQPGYAYVQLSYMNSPTPHNSKPSFAAFESSAFDLPPLPLRQRQSHDIKQAAEKSHAHIKTYPFLSGVISSQQSSSTTLLPVPTLPIHSLPRHDDHENELFVKEKAPGMQGNILLTEPLARPGAAATSLSAMRRDPLPSLS